MKNGPPQDSFANAILSIDKQSFTTKTDVLDEFDSIGSIFHKVHQRGRAMHVRQIDQGSHGHHTINEVKVTHLVRHDLMKDCASSIGRLQIDVSTVLNEDFDEFLSLLDQTFQVEPVFATQADGI